jgi:hypothetical protein
VNTGEGSRQRCTKYPWWSSSGDRSYKPGSRSRRYELGLQYKMSITTRYSVPKWIKRNWPHSANDIAHTLGNYMYVCNYTDCMCLEPLFAPVSTDTQRSQGRWERRLGTPDARDSVKTYLNISFAARFLEMTFTCSIPVIPSKERMWPEGCNSEEKSRL